MINTFHHSGQKGLHSSRFRIILIAIPVLTGLILYTFSLPRNLFPAPTSTIIEDRDSNLIGARIAEDGQWRFPALTTLPEKYRICLIQYEDRHFFRHPGVNPVSLVRALIQNSRAGKIVSGGSTITMQVIRLSRKGKPRNIRQKLIEIILATRLELRNSKEEILKLYSSHAPFGGNVVGLEAAAWRYYGRSPSDLSWAETAALTVLPNAPSLIYPGKNEKIFLLKRNRLLMNICRKGYIDSITCALSMKEPLPSAPAPLPSVARHLLERAVTAKPGKRMVTTLDAMLQQRVAGIIDQHYKSFVSNGIHNAAALVVEVESGNVLAYAGNTGSDADTEHGTEVDIITSRRSTGSILKPLLYAAMLDEGEILPGTLVPDIPTFYSGFTPKNFSLTYDGAVPAKRSLARSLNIPSVRMLQQFGIPRFHRLLEKSGLTTIDRSPGHYGLSLILGGAESTLWELTGLYASLSRILLRYNQSAHYRMEDIREPSFLLGGSSMKTPKDLSEPPLLSAAAIWLTYEALIEVNRPDTEAGWKSFSSSRLVAWKTGTSYGFRDAWAVGTTPGYVVGVWVGNADGEGRSGLTGVTAAAPIMFEIFGLLPSTTWFSPPLDELYPVTVCRHSGYRNGPWCDQVDTIYTTRRGIETPPCPYHTIVHLDASGKYRMNLDCAEGKEIIHVSWFILPPVMEWYYKSKNPWYKSLPPWAPGCLGHESGQPMDLIYPGTNAIIYVPVGIDGSRGEVVFEAAHRKPGYTIYWHLDDRYMGSTKDIHQIGLSPVKGIHTITLIDQEGTVLVKRFEVLDKN